MLTTPLSSVFPTTVAPSTSSSSTGLSIMSAPELTERSRVGEPVISIAAASSTTSLPVLSSTSTTLPKVLTRYRTALALDPCFPLLLRGSPDPATRAGIHRAVMRTDSDIGIDADYASTIQEPSLTLVELNDAVEALLVAREARAGAELPQPWTAATVDGLMPRQQRNRSPRRSQRRSPERRPTVTIAEQVVSRQAGFDIDSPTTATIPATARPAGSYLVSRPSTAGSSIGATSPPLATSGFFRRLQDIPKRVSLARRRDTRSSTATSTTTSPSVSASAASDNLPPTTLPFPSTDPSVSPRLLARPDAHGPSLRQRRTGKPSLAAETARRPTLSGDEEHGLTTSSTLYSAGGSSPLSAHSFASALTSQRRSQDLDRPGAEHTTPASTRGHEGHSRHTHRDHGHGRDVAQRYATTPERSTTPTDSPTAALLSLPAAILTGSALGLCDQGAIKLRHRDRAATPESLGALSEVNVEGVGVIEPGEGVRSGAVSGEVWQVKG